MHSVRRRLAALAAVLLAGGGLVGCVGQDPKPTPTPSASATPLYSSDEEALAAAKEAYAKYVDVTNKIAHEGWVDLSPLKLVAADDALKADETSAKENRSSAISVSGDYSGEVKSVQAIRADSIATYACLDVSGTRIIDSTGKDITSPNRVEVVPVEVKFVVQHSKLLVGRTDQWSGPSFCSS